MEERPGDTHFGHKECDAVLLKQASRLVRNCQNESRPEEHPKSVASRLYSSRRINLSGSPNRRETSIRILIRCSLSRLILKENLLPGILIRAVEVVVWFAFERVLLTILNVNEWSEL